MVAIVAMILAYLVWSDLKVAIYLGLGIVLAKWLYDSAIKHSRDDD